MTILLERLHDAVGDAGVVLLDPAGLMNPGKVVT
jgi:hypothetical protein